MKLNVKITQLNSTHGNSIAKLSKAVSQLQNLTETHEVKSKPLHCIYDWIATAVGYFVQLMALECMS